jgi:cysteine-S-conjugate beta-lyase
MTYDFDQIIDRRAAVNLNKWKWYPEDVLPMWLADMDFLTPQPIRDALHAALDQGILGYELPAPSLFEKIAARLERLYCWEVSPEMIVAVPGVNAGFRVAASVACMPGEGVLVQTPVFYDFLDFPSAYGLVRQDAPLQRVDHGRHITYELDPVVFSQALHSCNARTGMLLLCQPHNPMGKIFTPQELEWMTSMCVENGVVVCSDDIHNELLLGDAVYTPLAARASDVTVPTITLIGPGKSFNVSGLSCAFAVIPQAGLRQRFTHELERRSIEVNSLGLAAAQAAYSGACDDWLAALRAYLTANRDFLVDYVENELPGLRTTFPEATYLAWLDCNEWLQAGKITGRAQAFFLEQGKVALADGTSFGPGGAGFVRLSFACPRATLEAGLERMTKALRT